MKNGLWESADRVKEKLQRRSQILSSVFVTRHQIWLFHSSLKVRKPSITPQEWMACLFLRAVWDFRLYWRALTCPHLTLSAFFQLLWTSDSFILQLFVDFSQGKVTFVPRLFKSFVLGSQDVTTLRHLLPFNRKNGTNGYFNNIWNDSLTLRNVNSLLEMNMYLQAVMTGSSWRYQQGLLSVWFTGVKNTVQWVHGRSRVDRNPRSWGDGGAWGVDECAHLKTQ